jgi:type II secretory pathway component GspD/PulD (secretin)
VLKNIPVIGSVFSKTEMEDTTTEIIIFVTPHLLRGDEVVSWQDRLMEKPSQLEPSADLVGLKPELSLDRLKKPKEIKLQE